MTAGAIQEQLGPKLEAKNRPVEILAIDHAEKPSASVARKLAPERNRNERDLILTAEDREEIKRLVAAMISESASLQHASEQLRDLIANQGFTELVFRNPSSGETTVLGASLESHPVVDVLARAIEFSEREKKHCGGLGRLSELSVIGHRSPFCTARKVWPACRIRSAGLNTVSGRRSFIGSVVVGTRLFQRTAVPVRHQ